MIHIPIRPRQAEDGVHLGDDPSWQRRISTEVLQPHSAMPCSRKWGEVEDLSPQNASFALHGRVSYMTAVAGVFPRDVLQTCQTQHRVTPSILRHSFSRKARRRLFAADPVRGRYRQQLTNHRATPRSVSIELPLR